jgi:2-methylcitrate dehydratase PrpD
VPAALAAGELFGIDAKHFLSAITLGDDIGTRVSMTLGGLQFQMKTHHSSHSIANNFGAAAAAGCSAALGVQQMRWLMDYAAQQASGIAAWQRDTHNVEKAFVFGGAPARNGVDATLLIDVGASGVDDIFPAQTTSSCRLIRRRTHWDWWTARENGSKLPKPILRSGQSVLQSRRLSTALQLILQKHAFQLDQLEKAVVCIATSELRQSTIAGCRIFHYSR